ncbi:small heat shock protein [Wolfiporia cocos MD-104 SS10]|uniref:Small heat shock protein n=1 Tax=Wolfiporia cocos (strain MD-104) TaxID=742152 RepID=A0A2H3IVS0_WOLCO|nr:small heat shock protein [Wolfiporia cocos MD-104 SS10]
MSYPHFFYDPFAEFNRLLDDALTERNMGYPQGQGQIQRRPDNRSVAWPRIDVHENSQTNQVEATFELPGLRKEDVSIDVHNNRLTVSGESKQSTERNEAGYAVRERQYGKFSRTLQLPAGINTNDIKASMENGLLTVSFPRAAPQEGPKRITVF